jgi:hypothetical protein
VATPAENDHTEIFWFDKSRQDVLALRWAQLGIGHVHGEENQQLLGVGMADQIQDSTADLFRHTRLDFDSHRRSHHSVDGGATAIAVWDGHFGAYISKRMASGVAKDLLAIDVVTTHCDAPSAV